jgi:hypothetical protein
MIKKISSMIIVAIFATISLGAVPQESLARLKTAGLESPAVYAAKEFPEIKLITTAGEAHSGKLTRLEGEMVTLLPFPYWNLEAVQINVEDIHLIQMPKTGSKIGKGFLTGFGVGFIVTGVFGGALSKYNVDYQWALAGSFGAGAIGGGIGLLIGAISDAGAKDKYEFYNMSQTEKVKAIKKIMGY